MVWRLRKVTAADAISWCVLGSTTHSHSRPFRQRTSQRSCSPVSVAECRNSGNCPMILTIETGGESQPTNFINCNSAAGKKCHVLGQMCFETVPVNSTVPQLAPVPPIPGAPNCSDPIQITCPNPGNCNATFSWSWRSGGGQAIQALEATCVAQPECTCVFQGNVCYTPQ